MQLQFNRDWRAGEPATPKSEEGDKQESGEDAAGAMAGEVGPAEAASAGCASGDSIIADVACKTDAPIDPEYAVKAEMDLSAGGRIAYRAEGAGWIKTSIEQRLSST
eukprot:8745035-Pyramimonas_sp.AAC.1